VKKSLIGVRVFIAAMFQLVPNAVFQFVPNGVFQLVPNGVFQLVPVLESDSNYEKHKEKPYQYNQYSRFKVEKIFHHWFLFNLHKLLYCKDLCQWHYWCHWHYWLNLSNQSVQYVLSNLLIDAHRTYWTYRKGESTRFLHISRCVASTCVNIFFG
jgi:hypothetical protein